MYDMMWVNWNRGFPQTFLPYWAGIYDNITRQGYVLQSFLKDVDRIMEIEREKVDITKRGGEERTSLKDLSESIHRGCWKFTATIVMGAGKQEYFRGRIVWTEYISLY